MSTATPTEVKSPADPNLGAADFAALGVQDELVKALSMMRIVEPFEIQQRTVPDALSGRDILGRAPTGSGKTLAFGIPTLQRLAQASPARPGKPRGLILSPTRELAEQITRELEPLADAVGLRVLAVYGGKGLPRQLSDLKRRVDLLIACPGRLLDLIEQKAVSLGEVEIAVVDEADRMADMGFLPDVKRILDDTADQRQTVLYSATLDNDVQILIDNYQSDPVTHAVAELEPDLSVMDHRFIRVAKRERLAYLADVIDDTGSTVVFVRTRHGVDRLARQLRTQGITAGFLHGGRSQSQRDRALGLFTDGRVQALVATDVAARGIHVDDVACVVHYDPPADHKDYVHRSGRTARAGAAGVVVSFLDPGQVKASRAMQRKLGLEAEMEDPVESPGRAVRLAAGPAKELRPAGSKNSKKSKNSKNSKNSKYSKNSKPGAKPKSSSGPKSGGKPKGGSKPYAKSGSKPGGKPKGGPKPKSRSESSAEADSKPRSGSKPKSRSKPKGGPKPKSGSKPKAGSGSRSRPKSKSRGPGRPKSKRTGKPRPKNRKNQPKGQRR